MPETAASTPLLEQYEGVRSRYPGHLVLFRVGDFFETFGDDARLLSRELDVVLTARAPDAQGARTPMAGIPQHAVESYLGRLVRKGYKVALCDQVEDARFAKGLVRREVTRVVTPGTVVEETILGGPDHNFLACAVLHDARTGGVAVVDVTTGEWIRSAADAPGKEGILSALAAFQPREIVWAAEGDDPTALATGLRREFPQARVEAAPSPLAESELPAPLRDSREVPLEVQEAERRLAAYLRLTQPRLLPHLLRVERTGRGVRLVLDAKSLRHLEIRRPMNPDDPKGTTLLDVWDETRTSTGRRTLAFWLSNPLADPEAIRRRQDAVEQLIGRGADLDRLRERLRQLADISRIAARVAGRRVRPPELATLRASLRSIGAIREAAGPGLPGGLLAELSGQLEAPEELLSLLDTALVEDPPPTDDAGELFRVGHSPSLDRCREEERAALEELGALERREQTATGIKGLKVGYNQVFGYYLEVGRAHLARVPPHFRRKQTVAQAERFVTDELLEIEDRWRAAREAARGATSDEWERLLAGVDRSVARVHRLSRAVGELDALACFAQLAIERGYVRPTVDDSTTLVFREARHPVLDRLLAERFVPNDVELDASTDRLLVLTGPNMSGKSTYMRAVGLLVVLAQTGSFVPARFARVGCVTQLFTRMGFTDEIGRGKSSFMVEMSEVAEILRSAEPRSLILLDEVGRGTSTFDGLAIAWATLRHLHDVSRSRCILATHYHQLTELVGGLSAARNAHLAVREGPEGIVFLHRLVPGATDRSYGIHVARLAGLPEDVLREAERLLRTLEGEGISLSEAPRGKSRARGTRYTQAVLLDAGAPEGALTEELHRIDLDRLSPAEALERMREWKRRAPVPVGPGR